MFSANTYIERRKKLKEQLGSGVILLLGNEDSSMNYRDNIYPFRQDSSFLYFFGLNQPKLAAIIDIDENEEIIFGDELTIDDVVWTGSQTSIAEQAGLVGVSITQPQNKLFQYIDKVRGQHRDIHFLPPYRPENQIKLQSLLEIPLDNIPEHFSKTLVKAVVQQRSIKTEEELDEMEKAVNTTLKMHLTAMYMAKAGMRESDLAGMVQGVAVGGGGMLSYPVILTVNGQTLHNHHYHNDLKSGQLVLGDFGAETSRCYAGDITRTFPVDKKFTNRQKEIYNIVLKAETDCIKALKPGVAYRDVHLKAARIITDGLKDLGLMKGDTEEAVAAGAHALFFPHGLGHMIGLDVHDMEDLGEDMVGYNDKIQRNSQFGLKYLRLGKELEAGNVLTVEPGIYFIPELIDRWRVENKFTDFLNYEKIENYKDFSGIRIEDDVVITENGHQILGDPIPKTIEEIETIREGLEG
jgi:Xaa-Pro aminopeptidase